jgi:hypothetical protein
LKTEDRITARNANELARLKWENSVLKKILAGGWPPPTNSVPVRRKRK